MEKYTSEEAIKAIGLSENELECLIRTGKKVSKASASIAGQPNLELVFVEDGAYYKVRNYCDLYPTDDEVLIKPILLNEEIDGMKKNSGWIANLGNVDNKKASIPKDAKKYFFSNQGLVGYPSKIEWKSAKAINEFFHRGHLMACEIICKFINPRIQGKKYYKGALERWRENHRQSISRDTIEKLRVSRTWSNKYTMCAGNHQRHNIYTQFKQSNCANTDNSTRKGQSYFEKKIVDYLESKEGEKGYVNYEVRALFKIPSDKVPRANLLCARFYDSCGKLCRQESFCVVIPNMGSPEKDNIAKAGYKFSYEDGLEKYS